LRSAARVAASVRSRTYAGLSLVPEEELLRLQYDLRQGAYEPGPCHHFRIHDPKERVISAALFRDRVVHHALCNVIEPLLDRSFILDSYACRKGKGLHAALERCSEFTRRFRYVLRTDIVHFFPSMDHEVLVLLLTRRIADEEVLDLIARIRTSGEDIPGLPGGTRWFPGDDLFALRPRGLPIGNLTSQLFANVYLDPLDHFVKDELGVQGYIRYADDMLCFGNNKRTLHDLRRRIERFLHHLRLCLHEGKTQVSPVDHGLPFLGMVISPKGRRLKHANVQRIHRRVWRLKQEFASGDVTLEQARASLMGWKGFAEGAHAGGLIRRVSREAVLVRSATG
jgi:RNA-directed DNA polymerase